MTESRIYVFYMILYDMRAEGAGSGRRELVGRRQRGKERLMEVGYPTRV